VDKVYKGIDTQLVKKLIVARSCLNYFTSLQDG